MAKLHAWDDRRRLGGAGWLETEREVPCRREIQVVDIA